MVLDVKKIFLFLILLIPSVALAAQDPYEAVKNATDDLLQRLVEAQPLYEKDPEGFFSEVDATLGPFIDFEGFSKGVMAKYFRRASDDQKKRFQVAFRKQLIKTYAIALVEFDNEEVIVLPPGDPSKKPDRAEIRLEIHSGDGTVYPVSYTHLTLPTIYSV